MSRWNPDDIPQPCKECEDRRMEEMYEEYKEERAAERLAALDPTNDPSHDWATDREYREHMDEVAPLVVFHNGVRDAIRN